MAFSFNKLKGLLKGKSNEERLSGSGSLDPEIGFKLSYNAVTSTVKVTVLGARHLQSYFGLRRAHGYVVKVKLFPGDSKYETKLQEASWPVWNEEFNFQLNSNKGKPSKSKNKNPPVITEETLSGKFLSLTVYALLEQPKLETEKSKTLEGKKTPKVADSQQEQKPKNAFLGKFTSFKGNKTENATTTQTAAQRSVLEKRRTVGVATWNFDPKLFHNDLKNGYVGTPDIWRPLNTMSGGNAADANKDDNAGQVEITFLYTQSEDGMRDLLQMSILRYRCTVRVMQEQEKYKEPLYLKAAIMEKSKTEASWKSDLFLPSISARWESTVSVLKLQVFRSKIDEVSCYVSLGCKNKMGKKIMLGRLNLSTSDQPWTQCLHSPGVAKTLWLPLQKGKGEVVDD